MKKGFLFLLWLMISVVLASCSLTAIDGGKDTPDPTAENTSEP